jgi:DNA repair protein RadC
VEKGENVNYTTAMVQLPLVMEATRERIRSPADAARVCSDIENLAQETFQVLILNAKNYLIERQMVSLGLVSSSLVAARELFREAIQRNASALIMIHNHPSGDPTPSAEDMRITKQMIEAGRILGILVQDHVIVGRDPETGSRHISLREQGLCNFAASA